MSTVHKRNINGIVFCFISIQTAKFNSSTTYCFAVHNFHLLSSDCHVIATTTTTTNATLISGNPQARLLFVEVGDW
jgi:hypothetical protein